MTPITEARTRAPHIHLRMSHGARKGILQDARALNYRRTETSYIGLGAYITAIAKHADTLRDTRPEHLQGTDIWHNGDSRLETELSMHVQPWVLATLFTVADALRIYSTVMQKRLMNGDWGGERLPEHITNGMIAVLPIPRVAATVEAIGLGWLRADVPYAPHDLYRQPPRRRIVRAWDVYND